MSSVRLRYLAEIGIPVYALRGGRICTARSAAEPAAPSVAVDPVVETASARAAEPVGPIPAAGAGDEPIRTAAVARVAEDPADAWRTLEAEVRDCTKCALHRSRRQTVFGVGRRDASLLVIGEAPGEEEDRQGEPFVGPAGRLLNQMLRAIGLSRDQVYIANILKCRPPNNRDPRPDEADACSEYLDRQIALIGPRVLLAVGRVPAQRLLGTDQPVGRLRGAVHRHGATGLPLVVTYHPAYLLRTPIAKAKSWQDLCMLVPLLASSSS
jgi:uracil-DNA glycosylase family 4